MLRVIALSLLTITAGLVLQCASDPQIGGAALQAALDAGADILGINTGRDGSIGAEASAQQSDAGAQQQCTCPVQPPQLKSWFKVSIIRQGVAGKPLVEGSGFSVLGEWRWNGSKMVYVVYQLTIYFFDAVTGNRVMFTTTHKPVYGQAGVGWIDATTVEEIEHYLGTDKVDWEKVYSTNYNHLHPSSAIPAEYAIQYNNISADNISGHVSYKGQKFDLQADFSYIPKQL